MMEKHTCEHQTYSRWTYHACGKTAKYEHDGKWYCGTHYPPNVEARREKKSQKWQQKWDYESSLRDARTAVLLAEKNVIDEVERAVESKIELPELLYEAYCKLIIAGEELGRVVKEAPR